MMNRNRTMRDGTMGQLGEKPTTFGLNERWGRVIAYAGICFTGLFFFLFERKNRNVRWNGAQSLIVFGPLFLIWGLVKLLAFLLGAAVGWIPLLGWLVTGGLGLLLGVIGAIAVAIWLWLMLMAWFRPRYRLPFIGKWTDMLV